MALPTKGDLRFHKIRASEHSVFVRDKKIGTLIWVAPYNYVFYQLGGGSIRNIAKPETFFLHWGNPPLEPPKKKHKQRKAFKQKLTQLHVSLPKNILQDFKFYCHDNQVTMTSVIENFIISTLSKQSPDTR